MSQLAESPGIAPLKPYLDGLVVGQEASHNRTEEVDLRMDCLGVTCRSDVCDPYRQEIVHLIHD